MCLWKVHESVDTHPGIWWYIGRYADGDTTTKLCPAFEDVCRQAGLMPTWQSDELYYGFRNGSRVYAFGLKPQDHLSRYAKLRGLGVSGIYIDQTEELPADFAGELRARLRQPGYPHQLLFSPNPPNVTHWLAKEFPDTNTIPGRRYYAVSLYDNAHNLPPEMIDALETAYPPSHAKHRSVILGLRGLNVIGDPVYAGAFRRDLHVRPIAFDPARVLLEAYDFGKHHPCWLAAQQPYHGGLHVLGGVLGQDMFLDEFLPIVHQYRAQWFPDMRAGVQSCCDPAGSHANSQGTRFTAVTILRDAHVYPVWNDHANAPDVRLATIERVAGHMRHRSGDSEAFGITDDPSRFLRATMTDPPEPWPFLAEGCEAGYVWDEHMVSVGSKQVRKPRKDGWFEHGQNCLEYLELNFAASQPTAAELAARQVPRTTGPVTRPPGPQETAWMGR